MDESAKARGRIFISYRREETAYPAAWLFERLAGHFGREQIFKDIDSIDPGDDFAEVLADAVGSCDALIALIGTEWLVNAPDGTRRIDDPGDFVRLEIEAALTRNVRVVPVLVGGARLPSAADLPPTIAAMARRQALELSPNQFDLGTNRLLRVLERTLEEAQSPQPSKSNESAFDADRTRDADPSSAKGPRWRVRANLRHLRISPRVALVVGLAVAIAVLVPLLLAVLRDPGRGVIYEDDFSSRANGWDDGGADPGGGHYRAGTYRLYLLGRPKGSPEYLPYERDPYDEWGFPRSVGRLFPSAPTRVSVQVVARGLTSPDDTAYGVACRADPENSTYYRFLIWGDHVAIEKVTSGGRGLKILAKSDLSAVHRGAKNRIKAVCTTDAGVVHLAFSVNGQVVASGPDTVHPFLEGAVGLVVARTRRKAASVAEFDDFVVTRA